MNRKELTMDKSKDSQSERANKTALFRFGVLGDLVHARQERGAKGEKRLADILREKAEHTYEIPFSARTHVAEETIRDWLKAYRKGSFDALLPKLRTDAGVARAIPETVADALLATKEDHRDWSVKLVIQDVLQRKLVPEGVVLKPTTVHRLLSRHGLMEPETPAGEKDRRRFAFQKAGELWMSDVMHGPSVQVGKSKRKTYLIGFLDDATRVVPHAAFALSEGTAAFLPVFKQAVLRRGVPKRLFVDNGAAYRSQHLSLVCAKLGVVLIHARPYDAAAKGKQERFFRRVRTQLLPILVEADFKSLDALNSRLWAWLETEYHSSPHKGLAGQTPMDRWAQVADEVRYLDADLDDLFLGEVARKVQKDRTVSLNGKAYEVDASLVGQTVTLRFDPSLPGRAIQVHHDGKSWSAKVVDLYANCFVKRDRPSQNLTPVEPAPAAPEPPRASLRLRDLADRKERS
jgi:putative transposase